MGIAAQYATEVMLEPQTTGTLGKLANELSRDRVHRVRRFRHVPRFSRHQVSHRYSLSNPSQKQLPQLFLMSLPPAVERPGFSAARTGQDLVWRRSPRSVIIALSLGDLDYF